MSDALTPQSSVLHRSRLPPVAVRGDGIYLEDAGGRRYLDGSSGAAVSCLGHTHPGVIEAIRAQAGELAYVHTGFFTTEPLEELAEVLAASAPAGLDKVFFVSGGSEAMEAALKIARQYAIERGEPARSHIIARRQSYHGNTLGALSVGGHTARRSFFEPMLAPATHIAPCYAYRERAADETDEAYGQRAADELEHAILDCEPGSVLAFVAETVVGATLGAVPPVVGYFRRIREICDRHGVLLILDEVMCGMGRCGVLHACEADGISPDLLTLAKGLGAGYQPIGAVLVSRAIGDAIALGSGQLRHGHTYGGHATACAAALAVQRALREEKLIDNVRHRGDQLAVGLRSALSGHAHVGDIRGRGLLLGVEFVEDRDSRRPFAPDARVADRIQAAAFEAGLLCYPGVGTADGRIGDHMLLAPPFIISSAEVDELIGLFTSAFGAVLGD